MAFVVFGGGTSRHRRGEGARPTYTEGVSVTACIAFGSNLGDRAGAIHGAVAAIDALPDTEVLARSPLMETAPVGPGVQGAYLNAAALLRTTLPARDLLAHLHAIERAHGRRREAEERWGPRTLDLDLLLYGDEVVEEAGLRVPHPRMHERSFVLDPLCLVAPETMHPVLGRTVRQLREELAGSVLKE